MDQDELFERQAWISGAFSPAAPVAKHDLFAGRNRQMQALLDAQAQAGQHAVIYGDRGVGKTSLASVFKRSFRSVDSYSEIYTCNTSDSFTTIWRALLEDLRFTIRARGMGFQPQDEDHVVAATTLLQGDSITPEDVRRVLGVLSDTTPMLIFIDEFDRIRDTSTRTLFADTIKILSDQMIDVTLVPVGVGDTVTDLITEHASIERSVVQIPMPKMNEEELSQIIERGMEAAQMDVDEELVDEIVRMSQGLPHYTHLIAQHAARVALDEDRSDVRLADLSEAIRRSVAGVSQSIRDTYGRATSSNRQTIYKEVLLACALAETDTMNTFSASDVRETLREITGTAYQIPAFAAHLKNFSGDETTARGGVLEKRGTRSRFRYRFLNPLLPPFVVMTGRLDGLI